MGLEVWQDLADEISDLAHLVLEGLVRPIGSYRTTAPHVADQIKDLRAILVLADRKARPHLPAKPMTAAGRERDAEASLTIDKSRDIRGEVHGKEQGRRLMET